MHFTHGNILENSIHFGKHLAMQKQPQMLFSLSVKSVVNKIIKNTFCSFILPPVEGAFLLFHNN